MVDPQVQAFLPEPDRRARLHAAADQLLARYPQVNRRPPLFGALVGVKDIFHVDGFVTRAGSVVPPELFAGPEAAVIGQLRAAGALIAGKTVTTEFAYFEPGPTRNPHNLTHTPGGSSSGSAAAVAAGLVPLALGTQTIGSVIRPAAFCGIVGFKPTLGRIPTAGLVYFSRTVDHVGLFTQDVAGMAIAAAAVCADWEPVALVEGDIPILGIPDGPYLRQAAPATLALFEQQIERLAELGYTIWRVPTLLDIDELNRLHRRLAFGEFAREHQELYARHQELYRPRTAEIIEQGRQVSDARAGRAAQQRAHPPRPTGETDGAGRDRPLALPGRSWPGAGRAPRDGRSQHESALDPRGAARAYDPGGHARWAARGAAIGGADG